MRVKHVCPICCEHNQQHTTKTPLEIETKVFDDSGIHYIKCKNNHEYVVFFSATKYEILFDIGMFAYTDGYMRESVSSFSAALERFYEFFINFFLETIKIDSSIKEIAWKSVSNQSERQLGAFNYIYLVCFRKTTPTLNSKDREFRNKVIHKGYIPTPEETIKYSETIYNQINTILTDIENKFGVGVLYEYYDSITSSNVVHEKHSIIMTTKALSLRHVYGDDPQNGTYIRGFENMHSHFVSHL